MTVGSVAQYVLHRSASPTLADFPAGGAGLLRDLPDSYALRADEQEWMTARTPDVTTKSRIEMADITTSEQVNELLAALGEQLAAAGRPYELVVIGGSALLALGMIDRATRDVDLLALRTGDELTKPNPLPTELVTAAERVGRDFGLPRDWLNAGPASMLDLGMPAGFVGRLGVDPGS